MDWYKAVFPGVSPLTKTLEDEWATKAGAVRISAGAMGTLTGKGGDHLLADDLLKPTEANSETVREKTNQWYGETFYSRLNDRLNGTVTIVAQRLHERDVCGYLIEKQKNPDADQWMHVNLPLEWPGRTVYAYGRVRYERAAGELLHPSRIPADEVRKLKATMGANYEGQYNQRPTKMEGGRLMPSRLVREAKSGQALMREWGLRPCLYFDLATKAKESEKDDPDWSVIAVIARDQLQRIHLLHLWRKRCSLDEVAAAIIDTKKAWGCQLAKAEKIGLQHAMRAVMRLVCQRRRIPVVPLLDLGMSASVDIHTKVAPFEAALNAGAIHVPAGAPWLPDLEGEMRAWPRGSHDDQCVTIGYGIHDLENALEGEAPPQHNGLDPAAIDGDALRMAREKSAEIRRSWQQQEAEAVPY
jgi:predicted phage terminase large subunit-like protein